MHPHFPSWNSQPLCHACPSLNHLSSSWIMSVTRARVFTPYSRMVLFFTGSKRGSDFGEWLICEVPVQPWYRTYWHHQLGSESAAWALVYGICDTVSGTVVAVRVLRDVTEAIFGISKQWDFSPVGNEFFDHTKISKTPIWTEKMRYSFIPEREQSACMRKRTSLIK